MRVGFSLTKVAMLALTLVVMVGLSKAQTSSPEVIELETGDITKNIAVATGVATEGASKFYFLHNNDTKKRSVRIRVTPANHTGLEVYDKDDTLVNEFGDSSVFDADLAEGEKIKLEISAVRAKRIQFTLVITNTTPRIESRADTIPNPHRHARGEDVLKEVAPEIKIVETRMPQNAEMKNLVMNKSKTFSSFTLMTEKGFERIFVVHVIIPNRSEKVYEIEGVDFTNRPLDDPVWVDDYLIFDRSSNPHAAIHYVFNMNKRVLVAARAFNE